jgi:hypothetical protein
LIVAILFFFNKLVSVWYHIQIAPKGESEIEKLVDEINATYGVIEKLEKIAEWEAENVEYIYGVEPSFSFGGFAFYWIDGELKIRVLDQSGFNNDPKWIAYFKVGGCGELATLFCEVAKRAGLEARVVSDPGIDHSWVEVKINGSWVIADPTIYWWYVNDPEKFTEWNELWFNNKSWLKCWSFSRVVTRLPNGSILDITENYTKAYKVTISVDQKIERGFLRVATWKGSDERNVYFSEVNGSETVTLTLGGRIYKFELIKPTWFGTEKYGLRVYPVTEIQNKTIKLKIDRERPNWNFISLSFLLVSCIWIVSTILLLKACQRKV